MLEEHVRRETPRIKIVEKNFSGLEWCKKSNQSESCRRNFEKTYKCYD